MAKSPPGRERCARSFDGFEDRTQQQFKDECDIGRMVKRFGGLPPPVDPGTYADFSSAPDYLGAQLLVLRARERFEALPSDVRRRFDNDPAKLLAFVGDKANLAEARQLGLVAPEAPVPAVPAPASEPAK